jgi:hypothetical protein
VLVVDHDAFDHIKARAVQCLEMSRCVRDILPTCWNSLPDSTTRLAGVEPFLVPFVTGRFRMSYLPAEVTGDRVERIEEAVERLSRELARSRSSNRIWRIATALTALAAAALAFLTATGYLTPSLFFNAEEKRGVSSSGFTLLNRQSQKTVILDNDKFGTPNMAFIDSKGNYRIDLKVDDGAVAALNFYDARGRRGRFSVANDDEAVLEITGAEGKGGLAVRVGSDGSPRLKLTDATGKTLFEVPPAGP